APGAGVHAVSAATGEGMAAIRAVATGTSVLLGPSGAGKSTLVNALAGEEAMRTQAIRASDGRGRHTTTHRELIAIPGGLVIDTPGVRRVGLFAADEGLSRAYADIEALAAECRFTDCAHESEPDCAVLAAADSGDLPERRLTGWRRLRREAEWIASRTDARLRSERLRERKLIHRRARRDRVERWSGGGLVAVGRVWSGGRRLGASRMDARLRAECLRERKLFHRRACHDRLR
ncbi:ribosome small subunit-dependent GTPase A, partial [Actinoallomurus acaciae]